MHNNIKIELSTNREGKLLLLCALSSGLFCRLSSSAARWHAIADRTPLAFPTSQYCHLTLAMVLQGFLDAYPHWFFQNPYPWVGYKPD